MSAVSSRRVRCMPVAEWPAADRLAWEDALRPADPFDLVHRPASRWRDSTRAGAQTGYGRYLTWLDGQGLLDPDATPGDRVNRERIARYAADLAVDYADYTVVCRISQLSFILRAMVPDVDWRWVLKGAERIKADAEPVRDKQGRMQPLEELLQLGLDLMEQAETDRHSTRVMRAKLHRDGLMIASLTLRPLREANLGIITLDQHLVRRGTGWELRFAKTETKQKRAMQMSWPEQLVPPLECYLARHRPVLIACSKRNLPPTERLWMSSHGTPMTYCAIALQVKARTKAAFGQSVNPHLFRDCVATDIATQSPEQTADIASVLGHTTLETSEQHYNHASMVQASADHQDIVERIQQRTVPKTRRPKLGPIDDQTRSCERPASMSEQVAADVLGG